MSRPSPGSRVELSISGPQLVAPILGRVIGMLAARADCPIDKLDDAMLISDALAAHAPRFTPDGLLTVSVETTATALSMRVGPLTAGAAKELTRAAELPGVGNVLERVADTVTAETNPQGDTLNIILGLDR